MFMPSPSPDPNIQRWFTQLRQFQAACINNSASKLSLLNFANATILTYLPSTASQNNFLTSVGASTGCDDLQIADLTTYKTFRALLDYCHLLENEIFNALQALSVPALQTVDCTPYYAATVAAAFPPDVAGGKVSTGAAWSAALALLMVSMDPNCFTLAFRLQVNATVDKVGSTMKDLIPQIAVLG